MSNISLNSAFSQDIDMVVNPIGTLFDLDNNYDEVRGRSLDLSIHRPRSPSMLLSKCDKEYYICVKQESDRMVEDKPVNSLGSFSLEYVTQEVLWQPLDTMFNSSTTSKSYSRDI